MGDFYPHSDQQAEVAFANKPALTASSNAPAITSSASTNTKGAYVELDASWDGVGGFFVTGLSAGGANQFIDIAIGASSSETIIVNNIILSNITPARALYPFYIPLQIPLGARVSARSQASAASLQPSLTITPCPMRTYANCYTYGADTSTTKGVLIDAGTTLNTKGAYSEIVSSTSYDTFSLVIAFEGMTTAARLNAYWLVDLAIGASGSETVLISNYQLASRSETDNVTPQFSAIFDIQIPAGSRISIRAQCDSTDLGTRRFGALVYAFG